jgi:hypothetical protein
MDQAVFAVVRVAHVALGVFWAGTILFNALFLIPAVGDAGPDGAKVMGALQRRRLMDVLPTTAILTVLSGLWMYWRASSGFSAAYVYSPAGMAYGLGGVAAIIGLAIGIGIMRPASLRAVALGPRLTQLPPGPERDAQAALLQELRQRAARTARIIAVLLAITVIAMGAARYL